MSTLGQKPTFHAAVGESSLHPKADIAVAAQYVRFVRRTLRKAENLMLQSALVAKMNLHVVRVRATPPIFD